MKKNRYLIRSARKASSVLAAFLILAGPVLAGPALVCHRIEIGSAHSLPWTTNSSNLTGRDDYDLSHLVADTLGLLSPDTPVLVRMETLRRATIYAQRDPRIAKELLLKLQMRASDQADALSTFDFGYLIECYKQAQLARSEGMTVWGRSAWSNPAARVDGYGLVKKAIDMRGQDPEMEFAAALITFEGPKADHEEHVQKALAGAKGDPLLAQNVAENQILATAAAGKN